MNLQLDDQTLATLRREAERAGVSLDAWISSKLRQPEVVSSFPERRTLDLDAVKALESEEDVEKHLLLVARIPEPLDYHSSSRINVDQLHRALERIP